MSRLLMLVLVLTAAVGSTAWACGPCLEFIPAEPEPLPADAAKVAADFEQSAAEARARAEAIVETQRRNAIAQLAQLARIAEMTGRPDDAEAIRRRIATLEAAANPPATPRPNLAAFRGQHGKVLTLTVTGAAALNGGGFRGGVWGDGVYTDDSDLAAAAVHAGVLAPGQTGQVKVTILAGRDAYVGAARNGVESRPYGPWSGSFSIAPADGQAPPLPPPVEAPRPADLAPANLREFRDRVGQRMTFTVTGADHGSVWGDGVYTDDSTLAAAAVHAGVIRVGQTARINVTILPGQAAYTGSTRNGVTTAAYAAWGGSYRIDSAVPDIR